MLAIFENIVIVVGGYKDGLSRLKLTVQNVRGRKNMLTNVRSLIFSPSCVEALLSMTALALKSYTSLLARCREIYGANSSPRLSMPLPLLSCVEILFSVLVISE